MSDYKDLIADFAKRTRANLDLIEKHAANGDEAYEVTQLVNSLLGLLVFPRERFMNRIPETPLSELHESGWPRLTITHGETECQTLRELTSKLRHSISHCNLEFIADRKGELTGLRVWNTVRAKRNWEAELTLTQLKTIATKFIDLLSHDT